MRHHAILDLARHKGKVSVDELAQRFDVTPQTIRKDLNELCDRNLLARVHGGAMISSGAENVGYEARRGFAAEGKAAIARAVAALVPEHASVFIAIGTTTGAVAQELLQHNGLLVVTNDLMVASMMRPYPNIEVVIAGGTVRRADGGVVGEATVEFVRQYRVDHAIVGASAIDADGTLLDYDYREVKVTQAVLQGARNSILVADAMKFERAAPVCVGHIRQVGTFVTDHCPSDRVRRIATDAGVRIVEASTELEPQAG
jgi:DeoR family glycerol-3-phosphate regulon repressor